MTFQMGCLNLWLPCLSRTILAAYFHLISTFSSIQLLSHVWLFATPWTAAHQASLSITNPRSLLKLMSTESRMPSNHLILCHPLFLPPSIFSSIRVFSNESVLCTSSPKQKVKYPINNFAHGLHTEVIFWIYWVKCYIIININVSLYF